MIFVHDFFFNLLSKAGVPCHASRCHKFRLLLFVLSEATWVMLLPRTKFYMILCRHFGFIREDFFKKANIVS